MNTRPEKASRTRLRRRRFGVYDLTYEDVASPPFTQRIYALLDEFRAICELLPHVWRQLGDVISLALADLMAFMVSTVWRGVYPAIHLYWLSVLFDKLADGFVARSLPPAAYASLALSWMSCALVNVAAERTQARSLEVLTNRCREHFIPRLIRASLRVDLLSIQDLHTVFPVQGHFESEFPGGAFLTESSQLVQCTLRLISQVYVLFLAIARKPSPEREALLCFCLARSLVWWLAPLNAIGCSAYIYWPHSRHFERMKALFGLAFLTRYRADLVLDGIASSLETEYKRSAALLGDVETLDPTPWRTALARDWCWDVLTTLALDLPVAMYVLIMAFYLSPSSIASMALLQQANHALSLHVGEYTRDMPSWVDVCRHAKRLYDAIDYQSALPRGTEPFLRPTTDDDANAGMKISFRNVTFQYPNTPRPALHDVSFDISPGHRVLVVGPNGSGKSSMLKLLVRVLAPSAGEIAVDDVPVGRYDIGALREAVAYQTQAAVVYPLCVRDNIALALGSSTHADTDAETETETETEIQAHVEAAVHKAGCDAWIARLAHGYDTRLASSVDVHHGWLEGVYGRPSEALIAARMRHGGPLVLLSEGEQQRLASARTLLRIHNRPTRLVLLDEATSRLDPLSERTILDAILEREPERGADKTKTVVVVAHRFQRLARIVDQILCLKDGSLVEMGTHDELIQANGTYASLYHAQLS